MRYISLEDARKVIIEKRDKLIDDKPYGWEWEMNGYNGALFAVTSAVVKHPFELIRCKDCKWHRKKDGRCSVWTSYRKDEGFCDRAERKEE